MKTIVTILVVLLTVIYSAFVGADIATGNGKDLIVDGIMLTFWLFLLSYIMIDTAREVRHLERHLDKHHEQMARDVMKDLNKVLGDVFSPDAKAKTPEKVNLAKAPVKKHQSKGTRKVAQDGNKKA